MSRSRYFEKNRSHYIQVAEAYCPGFEDTIFEGGAAQQISKMLKHHWLHWLMK